MVNVTEGWVQGQGGRVGLSDALLGVAIIVFFALFERKRHELLQVVDRLKTWEQ